MKKKRVVMLIAAGFAVAVLGGAGFFAYQQFFTSEPPPPPPVAKKQAPPTPSPAPAPTPAPKAVATTGPTPSETLNAIAHAPGKAVAKAKDAIEARRVAGQSRIEEPLGGEPAAPQAGADPAPGAPAAGGSTTAVTTVARGVSATTQLEYAAVEASAEFRTFVASAKVSGVFQGEPARAMINGRLVRAGETVNAALGIRFEGVDATKRHLLFKDRNGALVVRKY